MVKPPWGMNDKLWAARPALALRAVNAIATEAALVPESRDWNAEEKKRYDKRRTPDTISAAAAADVRGRFWTEGEIAEDAHVRYDITEIFGAEAHAKVLIGNPGPGSQRASGRGRTPARQRRPSGVLEP